jgi:hypothetical protein
MVARIYKPGRTAMQAGLAGTHDWVLEFEPASPRVIEPLMGWTSSGDTRRQLRLTFATKGEAVAYATRNAIPFCLDEARKTAIRPKSYAANFAFNRLGSWTH